MTDLPVNTTNETPSVDVHAALHNDANVKINALVNSPAGAPPPGVSIVRAFPFAFDTPGILTGAPVYTPTVGDVLLDAWIEVDTVWDGTTPYGGIFMSARFLFPGANADLIQLHTRNRLVYTERFTTTDQVRVSVTTEGGRVYSSVADNPLVLPLTVVAGVSDEFVFTPVATGTPETFTVAPGTYTTGAAVVAAVSAAVGSASGEAFSTKVLVERDVNYLNLYNSVPNVTGDQIGLGVNDIAAALGLDRNPEIFIGAGVDPGSTQGQAILYLVTATPAT